MKLSSCLGALDETYVKESNNYLIFLVKEIKINK